MIKFVFVLLFFSLASKAAVIVIDPGHGGSEAGAEKTIGRKGKEVELKEKDLALKMAKQLKKILKKNHQVYLTRSYDKTMGLRERAAIAEKVKADLFISIHLNASQHKQSHGFETYYLSPSHDEAVKKIEEIENQGLSGEELEIQQILIDLAVQKSAALSEKLAHAIHGHLGDKIPQKYKLRDRGMKPALFYVLALSQRPSVLLEAGFLSNDREVLKILSRDFQQDYVAAVAQGIDEYASKNIAPPKLPLF